MPATNYTPIQLYRSTTSGNTPLAANMSAGEIALNIADNDMSMWMENASGTVKRFFNNPAALKYPTADGTSGQVIVTDGSGNLSFATPAGGALTNNVRQAVTSSSTTTLDLNSGNVIDLTMAANITSLSFTNVPASGTPILIQIVVRNASDGTAYTIAWPNSVYWSGQYAATTISTVQTAPTLATGANGITVIALLTTDGGTKWRGWVEATIAGGAFGSLYAIGGVGAGLGLNSITNQSSPIQIGSLTTWASIGATRARQAYRSGFGSQYTGAGLAIKTDGTLWAWGFNSVGSLGQNDTTSRSSPVQVGALTNWQSVTGGPGNILAIKTDGTLWSWGANANGALGQNTSGNNVSSPVQVGSGTTWAKVASNEYRGGIANFSSFAIKTDGTLWSWGTSQGYGMLGLGNASDDKSSPTQVGSLTNWAEIGVGGAHVIAAKTDGTLWAWGRNPFGILGLNDITARSSPVQIGAGTNWSKVAASSYISLAIKTDGTLWSWGRNIFGSLGLNGGGYRSSPVQIGALTNWSSISSVTNSTFAVKTDGTLWVFGQNSYGQLGLNSTVNVSSPVQVGAITTWSRVAAGSVGNYSKKQFGLAISSIPVNPA